MRPYESGRLYKSGSVSLGAGLSNGFRGNGGGLFATGAVGIGASTGTCGGILLANLLLRVLK